MNNLCIQILLQVLENNKFNFSENIIYEFENNLEIKLIDKINESDNYDNESIYILFILYYNKHIESINKNIKIKSVKNSLEIMKDIFINNDSLIKTNKILFNLRKIYKIEKNQYLEYIKNYSIDNLNFNDYKVHIKGLIILIKSKDKDNLIKYLKYFNLYDVLEYLNGGYPFDESNENHDFLPNFMIKIKEYGNYNWFKWLIDNKKEIYDNDLINNIKIIFSNNYCEIKNKIFNNQINFIDSLYFNLNSYYNKRIIYDYIEKRKNKSYLIENYLENYEINDLFQQFDNKAIFNKIFNDYNQELDISTILRNVKEEFNDLDYFESKILSVIGLNIKIDELHYFEFYYNILTNNLDNDKIKIFINKLKENKLDIILILKFLNSFSNILDIKYQKELIKKIKNENPEKEIEINIILEEYNNKIVVNKINNKQNDTISMNETFKINLNSKDNFLNLINNKDYKNFYIEFKKFEVSTNINNDIILNNINKLFEFLDLFYQNNLIDLFINNNKECSYIPNIDLLKRILNKYFNLNSLTLFKKNKDIKICIIFEINYFILILLNNFNDFMDDELFFLTFKLQNYIKEQYLSYYELIITQIDINNFIEFYFDVFNNII